MAKQGIQVLALFYVDDTVRNPLLQLHQARIIAAASIEEYHIFMASQDLRYDMVVSSLSIDGLIQRATAEKNSFPRCIKVKAGKRDRLIDEWIEGKQLDLICRNMPILFRNTGSILSELQTVIKGIEP